MKLASTLALCFLIVVGVGCTSLTSDKALKHEVVTLDNAVTRAESVKAGILNHAVIGGKQDSEEVKKAVALVDQYIDQLKQQKTETEAILNSRTPAGP